MIFGKGKTKREADKDRGNLLMGFPLNSRFAESFRTLRTNLFFSAMEKEIQSVIVTSSVEKEGKTITAANLGYTIAITGRKVLLMDCDLRRPHLTALFAGTQEKGITGIISEVLGERVSKGSLDEYSVSDIVMLTKCQKRSCLLNLDGREFQVAFSFENGVITDVYWKNRPDAHNLSGKVMKNNMFSENMIPIIKSHLNKSTGRLGSVLASLPVVPEKEIVKILSVHALEAIRAANSMKDGNFTISPLSVEEKKGHAVKGVDIERLYFEFSHSSKKMKFIEDAIDLAIQNTGTDNLLIMPAGFAPPNPSEMLDSKQMELIMTYLKKKFDFIIIDTPPVVPATDALILAPLTDGTIFVMKSGNADRKIIKQAIEQHRAANIPIIGTVLSQVDMKKEGYYRYQRKYYSSYYGT